jgi:holliday junction DNA helicase RuvA
VIASLTGRLSRKANDYLIVNVSGVGYRVQTPLSTYRAAPDVDEEIRLHIHTHVREDAISLFGFMTMAEKEMFLLLIGVSGIGPKLALSILSNMSVDELVSAILSSDGSALLAVPGIGKKTAARMALELKDKVKLLAAEVSERGPAAKGAEHREDAVSALVNLGFRKQLAEEALKSVQAGQRELSVEELIREALGALMKR